MKPDPTRVEPGDDLLESGADPDLVDAIALEALTAGPEGDAAEIRDPSDPLVGRRLGAYRLLARVVGTGRVYLAARAVGLERRVAVERVEGAADDEAIVRRARDRARAQAALAGHPDLAPLLDAGTDDEGRPCLVIADADGRPIEEFADDRRLDVPARLRLFARACDAVAFAHRHAVLHGDLTPGRILVDDEGTPRVVGFGAAGLADPGSFDRASPKESDSPERVLGGPPTTAGDVYGLGVILYRLLTGRGPYRLGSGTVAEVVQAICEQAPERPSRAVVPRRRPGRSAGKPADPPAPAIEAGPDPREVAGARRTTPARLARSLAGDLDAIILMAMRQEPERRYPSAEAIADDVHRHLDGRPVHARGESRGYRVATFARRNAVAIAATVAVWLAMAAGVVVSYRMLTRERRHRERAEAVSRQDRRAVDDFLARVLEGRQLDQPGLGPLRRELLQEARAFYEGLLAGRDGEPASPDDRVTALDRLGRIAAKLDPPAEADVALQRAVAAWEEVLAARPDDREAREPLARALRERATVLLRLDGRRDEALDACRRAAALLEPLRDGGDPVPIRRELAGVLLDLARIESDRGRPTEALEPLRRALELEERLAAEDPSSPGVGIALARAHGLLARILMGRPDGLKPALAAAEQAVAFREAVVRDRPEWADQSQQLALDLADLSAVQQSAGKLDSALAGLHRALEILERLDREHPGVTEYRAALGRVENLASELHRRRDEPAEALAMAEKARDLLGRLFAAHPEDAAARAELARSHADIGRVQRLSGDPAEALASFRKAVELLEGLPKIDPRAGYELACDLSLCLPLFGARPGTQGVEDDQALSPGDQVRRRVFGDRAIEVLRRAAREGSLDAEALDSDPDLAALRDREDFRRIVRDLEKPAATPESGRGDR